MVIAGRIEAAQYWPDRLDTSGGIVVSISENLGRVMTRASVSGHPEVADALGQMAYWAQLIDALKQQGFDVRQGIIADQNYVNYHNCINQLNVALDNMVMSADADSEILADDIAQEAHSIVAAFLAFSEEYPM